jgi:drug/metabolite transporter (DMT)-like permease
VAYFLLYTGIILSGYFFSFVLYHKKLTPVKFFSVLLSLVGLFLMFINSWQQENSIYMIMALCSGLAGGFWYTAGNKLQNIPHMQLVFLDAIFVALLSFIGALFYREPLPIDQPIANWLIIVIFALVYIFGVKLTVYGFQKLDSHLGNLIMPMEAIFGAIFGFIFFKEFLVWTAWLGGILIFVAALLPNLLVKRNNQ